MVIDGAMGTMIQSYNLTENDFRGKQNTIAKLHRVLIIIGGCGSSQPLFDVLKYDFFCNPFVMLYSWHCVYCYPIGHVL